MNAAAKAHAWALRVRSCTATRYTMQKLTKRAQALFPSTMAYRVHGVPPYAQVPATLLRIAQYAAQNPGLDFGNYGNLASYRAESRQISKDLANVRQAMHSAVHCRVTDEDIMKACPRTFMGRLTVTPDSIDYCTGQYWPTEYRRACLAVLELAIAIALERQA